MIESIALENFYCFNKRTEVSFVAGRERSRSMDEMYSGFNEQNRVNLPQETLTYKAMGYLLRHYGELTAYLDIAGMPVDNNDTEREIRSMVMGKKSYLFCRNDEACHRAALMYSMFGACKVLGKDAEKWLAYTLKHIGSTKPENLYRLLPEEWTE